VRPACHGRRSYGHVDNLGVVVVVHTRLNAVTYPEVWTGWALAHPLILILLKYIVF
jgi:hypothetical protein